MATIFETGTFVCFSKMFSQRAFMRDKRTGAVAVVDGRLVAAFQQLAAAMARTRLTDDERAFLGGYFGDRMGQATFDPDGLNYWMMVNTPADESVDRALVALRDMASAAPVSEPPKRPAAPPPPSSETMFADDRYRIVRFANPAELVVVDKATGAEATVENALARRFQDVVEEIGARPGYSKETRDAAIALAWRALCVSAMRQDYSNGDPPTASTGEIAATLLQKAASP